MDIERITKDFEEIRATLRMSIGKYDDVEKSKRVYQHIAKVASDSKFKEIQLNDLKCYVGGYIFIDPETKEVIPLFGSNKRTQGKPAYPLSYVWSNKKIDEQDPFDAFMDNIFIAWRTNESIRADDLNAFKPEYLYHLPSAANTIYPNLPKHPVERSFNETTGCLYCPMGEVAFYVYAWRFLVRTIWLCNGDINKSDQYITLDENFDTPESIPKRMWDPTLWSTGLIRENEWSNIRMNGVIQTVNYFNEKIDNLQEVYPYKISPWKKDWNAMLLIEKKGKQEYTLGGLLLPLLEFASFLAVLKKHPQRKNIKSYIESIKANPNTISENKLTAIDKSLRIFIIDYFSSELNIKKNDANKLLEKLHSIVRFPVIAYFYWNYFDEAPRTHMVIPVWSSNLDRVRLPFKNDSTDLWNHYETGILGVSVIGTNPFSEFDWTINGQTYNFDSLRFSFCREYFEIFSQYIVDDWFFTRIKDVEHKRTLELAREYSHRMSSPIADIQSRIQSIKRFYQDNDDLIKKLDMLSKQIKKITFYKDRFKDLIPNRSPTAIDIKYLLSKIFGEFQNIFEVSTTLKIHCNFSLKLLIDEYIIYSIFHELLYNAYSHNKKRNDLAIECDINITNNQTKTPVIDRSQLSKGSNLITIRFLNKGKCIPENNFNKIFLRSFTTKMGGTGFGLYRIRQLVEDELGGVIIPVKYNQGAIFVISFLLSKNQIIK